MALNIADLFEHAVDAVPDRVALIVDDEQVTYAELDAQANRLAHFLAARGIGRGDHVGILSVNTIEYVVAMLGLFKIRAVPINVNYRYVESELDYIAGEADLVAMVLQRSFLPVMTTVAARHPALRTLVVTEDGSGAAAAAGGPAVARWDEALAAGSPDRDFGERSADDLYILFTGGTTGYPKGVVWRHEDVWRVLGGGINFTTGEAAEEYTQSRAARESEPMMTFPLPPLMHGATQWSTFMHLFAGQTTILIGKFDPHRVWQIVDKHKVALLFMSGDAMARPLIEAYGEGPYEGTSLMVVSSSAALFSLPVKQRWMATFPNAFFTDSLGSSETGFSGTSVLNGENLSAEGPVVSIGPETVVFDDDLNILDPDTNVGAIGRSGRGGHVPLGYYGDEEKSKATFIERDGKRYAIPGDYVRIESGRRLTLLGRGSNCINTGGEKVYPEEVEVALKSHPGVYDALVVAIPDDRYGQLVSAVVQPREGAGLTLESVQAHLRPLLSGYKLPRVLAVVEEIPRHVTGKANYPRAKEIAMGTRGES